MSPLTVRDSREKFKKYFADRFDLGSTGFEDYLRTGLPQLRWEYVATALSVNAGDWDPDLAEVYLQWLMDAFDEPAGPTPTFLFFFVIWLQHAHFPERIRADHREALDSVKQLVERNEQRATLISPLPPVPAADLEEWLQKLSDQVTQVQKNDIIQALAAQLNDEERARFEAEERLLDMERVEDLQQRVWEMHR